ncbi:unnamed protein product [Phyllotreta striolata]|uniref:Uncharacterized protein n=1 Tax=Phyllotreta striolata TaxID=444603 RepID=A0A9N9TIL4_PHYSR|nr:unnamed protein product [Phyllotreta striolata]
MPRLRREIAIKFVAAFLVFCFAECAAGSCLNYGHACWGAHGKRSGTSRDTEEVPVPNNLQTRWFLSKLIQGPVDFRYLRDDFDGGAKLGGDRLFPDEEMENPTGDMRLRKNADQIFEDSFLNGVESNRIRLPKVLDKRSTKLN